MLSSLTTKEQLASALGVSFQKHLVYYLHRLPDSEKYSAFEIKKRGGGRRQIHAPHHGLKSVQRKLAELLSNSYGERVGVHGYIEGRSTLTNALNHVRRQHVLNIDLENFFSSINFGRVRGILTSPIYGASSEVATVIAQLCCFENQLPQGAPTSPVISNMICGKLDSQLKRLARENGCTYSRYCDDITFSSFHSKFPAALATVERAEEGRVVVLGELLVGVVESNGFKINSKKSRLLSQSDRQDVTGLTVNRFPNVPRKYVRNLRAALHAWQKYGLEKVSATFLESFDFRSRDKADFERVILGRIQYVGQIRGFDDEIYRRLRKSFNALSSRKIPIHESSSQFKMENSIWVFESTWVREADGSTIEDCSQGTAFFLKDVGLVTCAHCVGDKNYIYHTSNPTKHYDVELRNKSDDIDVAILTVSDEAFSQPPGFPRAADSDHVERGDRTVLAGFPQYGPGSELSVKEGSIQSIKRRSGVRRFNLSTPIIAGNSGGPVFNNRGEVIGIAVTGADSIERAEETEAHGVIPISALSYLN